MGQLAIRLSQEGGGRLYQIVISNATMMSSFRISAVNEMETMFKNSFSNRIRDMIIIADPTQTKPRTISIPLPRTNG